jgi:hypothetical protein
MTGWRRRKQALRRFWYKHRHGIRVGFDGSMLPILGHGRFFSLHKRGEYLDIVSEHGEGMIRLVPYQPNHGVMVEFWPTPERLAWRTHCDFDWFQAMGFAAQETSRGAR